MKRLLALLLCTALLIPACAALAETEGQKSALECALIYLDCIYFSRSGLYYQLLFEQYSPEDAAWAIEQLDSVDWFDQAAGSAEEIVEFFPDISPLDLGQSLLNSGFTAEEARYGSAVALGEPAEKPAVTCTPAPLPEGTIPPYLTEDHPEIEETPAPESTTPTPEPASAFTLVIPTPTPAPEPATAAPEPASTPEPAEEIPESRLEALEYARDVTEKYWYSRLELYVTLINEGFSGDDALYAVDNVGLNWYEEAAGLACAIVEDAEDEPVDRGELVQYLCGLGYSEEEAEYAAAVAFGEGLELPAVTPVPGNLPTEEEVRVLIDFYTSQSGTPDGTEPPYTPVPDLTTPTPEPPAPTPVPSQVTLQTSSLTTEELIALRKQVDEEIHSRPEWKEVEVPAGTWSVGSDIPAGTYSIRSLSQYSGTIYIYKKNSTTFDDYYSIRYGETLGKVTLEDGWKVEVMGTLVFAPPEAPAFH